MLGGSIYEHEKNDEVKKKVVCESVRESVRECDC